MPNEEKPDVEPIVELPKKKKRKKRKKAVRKPEPIVPPEPERHEPLVPSEIVVAPEVGIPKEPSRISGPSPASVTKWSKDGEPIEQSRELIKVSPGNPGLLEGKVKNTDRWETVAIITSKGGQVKVRKKRYSDYRFREVAEPKRKPKSKLAGR